MGTTMDIFEHVTTSEGALALATMPRKLPAHLSTPARYPVTHLEIRGEAYRAARAPALALAVAAYEHAISRTILEQQLALGSADAIVSGRAPYLAYRALGDVGDAAILSALPDQFADRVTKDVLTASLQTVRKRVDQVCTYLESGGTKPRPSIGGLDWIANASEAQRPWAPLNVGVSPYAWRSVDVAGVAARYIATGDPFVKKARVVLYLHGLGSRAEEGAALGTCLAKYGPYVVVAPDLPGNGYTEIVPPKGGKLDCAAKIADPTSAKQSYPFLEHLDRFVSDFVATLEAEHPGFAQRVVCIAGGSLGGNLALRATLNTKRLRPRAIASWSAGSVWDPFVGDAFKTLAVNATYADATMDEHIDATTPHWVSSTARDAYLDHTFVQQIAIEIGTPPRKLKARGPEMWWRHDLPDFAAHEANSLADRLEVYDERFRRWQSRLAYEQLLFSHRAAGRLDKLCADAKGPIPTLLLAGESDDYYFANIHDRMLDLARKLAQRGIPGSCHLLADTGHSIHDERPTFLARVMHEFLKKHVP